MQQPAQEEGHGVPARQRKPSAQRAARYLAERDELVRATYRLLEQGDDAAGVHDILREAGLSTRAFYRHFPSKDDLLLFIYREQSTRVARRLSVAVAEVGNAAEALDAWVGEYLAVVYQPRRAVKAKVLASMDLAGAAGFGEARAEEAARLRSDVEQILRRGLEDGSIPFALPEQDAYAVHALVNSYMSDRLFGSGAIGYEQAKSHTVQLFLRKPTARQRRR